MNALILAGGLGTRLRPFTLGTAKPLLPVVNRPLVSYQLFLLKKLGIRDVVLAAGYRPEDMTAVVRVAADMGMKVRICVEKSLLGTAGAIANARKFMKKEEPVLVFNGDIVADFNMHRIVEFHREKGAIASICLAKVSDPSAYGLVVTDASGRVRKFVEKPSASDIVADTINAGLYVLNPEFLDRIPCGRESSIEKEVFPTALQAQQGVWAYVHYGYWVDVGTVQTLMKANFDVLRELAAGLKEHAAAGPGERAVSEADRQVRAALGRNVVVESGADLKGCVILGDGCHVGNDAVLQNVVAFEGTVIGRQSVVSDSILGKNVLVGSSCVLRNAAVADRSTLRDYTLMNL